METGRKHSVLYHPSDPHWESRIYSCAERNPATRQGIWRLHQIIFNSFYFCISLAINAFATAFGVCFSMIFLSHDILQLLWTQYNLHMSAAVFKTLHVIRKLLKCTKSIDSEHIIFLNASNCLFIQPAINSTKHFFKIK